MSARTLFTVFSHYLKETVNLGTQNLPLADQPVVRVINGIGLHGTIMLIVTDLLLAIFAGMDFPSVLISLFYLILFPSLVYLNHRGCYRASRIVLVAITICVTISLPLFFPSTVTWWTFCICDFLLIGAVFKQRKQIFILSSVITLLVIGGMIWQHRGDYQSISYYAPHQILYLNIIFFSCTSICVLFGVLFVRTNLQQQQQRLEAMLGERNLLLKEIHHRVKNNLQIVASLLYLQSDEVDNLSAKKMLEEGQGRVRSMALIHQKLYENDNLSSIPFEEYLDALIKEIQNSFGESAQSVTLEIQAKNIYLDLDTAIPLALIVNELSTNAFKYAFPNRLGGAFKVHLSKQGRGYFMQVSDNGVGIPDDKLNATTSSSLGLKLARILSEQLDGQYGFSNTQGTTFELKFAV